MSATLDNPPLYDKMVDQNGSLSGVWRNWFGTFIDSLNGYFTQNGFVLPQLSTAQRDAIATPAQGQMIYNTTTGEPQIFLTPSWRDINHT
jgi:hypothetical protein